jgi:hypothetical protein
MMFETDTLRGDMLRLIFSVIAISVLFGLVCGVMYVKIGDAKIVGIPDV